MNFDKCWPNKRASCEFWVVGGCGGNTIILWGDPQSRQLTKQIFLQHTHWFGITLYFTFLICTQNIHKRQNWHRHHLIVPRWEFEDYSALNFYIFYLPRL